MEYCESDLLHNLLAAGNCHAFFTSRGLTAEPTSPYDGFNICHYTGDDPDHVEESRQNLSRITGIEPEKIIVPTQTHSTRAVEIKNLPVDSKIIEGCDGLVTRLKNVIIGVNTADCVPVVMMDQVNEVIGVAHAGWRGAIGGIVRSTLGVMLEAGAERKNIRYALGPSICPACFEVGEEVAERFPEEFVVRRSDYRRPHVDLQSYIAAMLEADGVSRNHGEDWNDSSCTRHHPDRFFSARAHGTASGRIFTFAFII